MLHQRQGRFSDRQPPRHRHTAQFRIRLAGRNRALPPEMLNGAFNVATRFEREFKLADLAFEATLLAAHSLSKGDLAAQGH